MFTTTAILKQDMKPCWLGCSNLQAGDVIPAGLEVAVTRVADGLFEITSGPTPGLWISEAFLSFDLPK